MKKLLRLTLLLCALIVGSLNTWADPDETVTFSEQGYSNQQTISSYEGTDFSVTFNKGTNSNDPKYYTSGSAIRAYGGNYFTVSSTTKTIEKIVITFGSSDGSNAITTDEATYQNGTWEGSASSVTFTIGGTSGNRRIAGLEITYASGGGGDTPTTYTVTYDANGGTGTMTDSNSPYEENAEVTLLTNTFTAPEGKLWSSWSVKDSSNNNVSVSDGKFTMPASNVTVTAQWADDPNAPQYEWVETSLSSLSSSDIFAIVGTNGGTYAMSNNNGTGSAPSVTAITIANGKINTDATPVNNDLKWNVSGDATNGYTFYPNGSTTTWLYCNTTASSGSNNNLRVGTGDRKAFEIDNNYLKTKDDNTVRYVSIYSAQDWRGYVSSSTTVKFYKRQVVSSDPAISASDVNITYDATGGSIAYTLANATGNVTASVTTGSWLTLGTITDSEVPFTCSANAESTARTATVTLSFTGANDKVVTITQAAAPVVYTTIPAIFEAATTTATEVNVTFNNWVVSGVSTNGKNVFVTDNAGNGFVIYSSSDQSSTYAVGNILSGTITCSLKLNQGYAQLTNVDGLTINTGGTVSTANIALPNLAGVNTGALVSYEGLMCSVENSKYYLTDGTTTLQVYNSLYAFGTSLESGHIYNITGIYQQYVTTKEILPRNADDIAEVSSPAISATPASLTGFTYEVDNGPSATKTISVSGSNLTEDITLSLGDNSDFEMCLTEDGTYANSLTLAQSAGAVAATTVYVRLKEDLAIGESYSGTITLTSAGATNATVSLSGSVTAPTVDYATLPFAYDDGKDNLPEGLTQNGLGTNYGSSPMMKFDTTGDYVVLKINETPGILAFDVKANPSSNSWEGTLTVQTAGSDGNYTDFTSYSDLYDDGSKVITKTITDLPATVRYIKWIYTKTTGNVALGNIKVVKPLAISAALNAT